MPSLEFDVPAYHLALQRTMHARGVTPELVARDTGVGMSVMNKLAKGRRIDAASLQAVSAWSGLSSQDYVRPAAAPPPFDPEVMVDAIKDMARAERAGDTKGAAQHELALRKQFHAIKRLLGQRL